MILKRYILPAIIALCLYVIFVLVGKIHWEIHEEAQKMSAIGLSGVFKLNILAFLFGLLIEWQGIRKILQRKIEINKLIIIPIIIFLLGIIPNHYWMFWFGIGMSGIKMGTVNALIVSDSHILLMVLSGVLLVRSLAKKEDC